MKKLVLVMFMILFVAVELHAQNQFSLNADTTKTGLLGFNKQSRRSLSLKNSIELPDLKFQELANANTDEAAPKWNMPIYKPESIHTMPIRIPDSTSHYSMMIVRPESYNN